MEFKNYRLSVVGLVALITLALLLGGWHLYIRQTVDRPLAQLFSGKPEILEYKLNRETVPPRLTMKLGPVDNLQESYLSLYEKARTYLGEDLEMVVLDERNQRLEEAYRQVSFSIEEAIARGNFTEMAEAIRQKGRELQLDKTEVAIDKQFLYLHLRDGDNYLYAVAPRKRASEGGDKQ